MVHSRGAARRHRREDGPGTLDRLHRRPTPPQLVGQRVNAPTTALLEALDEEQREVATHFDSPVIVLAGAGTGKTRAMTHRIAYGIATEEFPPNQVLALTYTAEAAGDAFAAARARRARGAGAHLPFRGPAPAALLLGSVRRGGLPAHHREQGRHHRLRHAEPGDGDQPVADPSRRFGGRIRFRLTAGRSEERRVGEEWRG